MFAVVPLVCGVWPLIRAMAAFDAASQLAIALAKGQSPTTATAQTKNGSTQTPSVLLTPVAITKDNVKTVIDDGFLTKSQICVGQFAKACTDAGL